MNLVRAVIFTLLVSVLCGGIIGAAATADTTGFTASKITVTGAGGPTVDDRFDLGRARGKGGIDTRSHYRVVEKTFADGGFIDDPHVLDFMSGVRNGRKREYWADWRSFATILVNAELDTKQVMALAQKELALCNVLRSSTRTPAGNSEGIFNALNFVRFFGPKYLTAIIRDGRCKMLRSAPEVYELVGQLAPETAVINLPQIVQAAVADLGHTIGKPLSRVEFQRRSDAWLRALHLAAGRAKADWTLVEAIAVKASGYVLRPQNSGYDAMQGKFLAAMIRVLVASGAEMNEQVQFALGNNADKPGSAKHTLSTLLKNDMQQAQVRTGAHHNLQQLTDALKSGHTRKIRTFIRRVLAGPDLPGDQALLAAIASKNGQAAGQLLGAGNLIFADTSLALAIAVEKGMSDIARQLASTDEIVANAIGKTRQAARGKDLQYRYELASRIAALGGPLAHAQLAAAKQQLDAFRARAQSQQIAQRKKAEQQARLRSARIARTRAAHLAPKSVGQRVCQDVTIALGMLDVRLTAFVEQIKGNRLQLRIHGTEHQTIYYHGGRLRPGHRIWDATSNWANCLSLGE